MATHYSGMEDTSMENPESQDIDSDSQQNYQEEHIVLLQHLTHEMEQLRQTVEDKNNDPRDAITHLEQNCNQLAITLHPHRTHRGSIKQIYRHFVQCSEENIFRKLIVTRYSHIKWK